jgi:hypothetical protein
MVEGWDDGESDDEGERDDDDVSVYHRGAAHTVAHNL